MTSAAGRTLSKRAGRWSRHRLGILLGAVAAAALCAWVAVYGSGYYWLPARERVLAAAHPQLKPSGAIGHRLGILGAVLFGLMYLYPLRKRWAWLARRGRTKNWLDYHILMGLTAPFIVTFHAAFKLHGIAGLAYWIMIAVVLSGIVGRYLYGHLPRRLDQAEMSLEEMREASQRLERELKQHQSMPYKEVASLFALPQTEQVQSMPLLRAVVLMVALDLRRYLVLLRLQLTARGAPAELKEALVTVRKQSRLTRDILFLSKMKQLFHIWHVVHRPFSYSFAVLVLLHIAVVLLLGYY